MASVSNALKAKSDQLNFVDIGANGELQITITSVVVRNGGEQLISVFYDGCDNKPWKPSKGMGRLMKDAWGDESDCWVGKSALLYGEATVKWAGAETGGIRIRKLSDLKVCPLISFVQLNSNKRVKVTIPLLIVEQQKDIITEIDQGWIDAAKADITVLEQITDSIYRNRIQSLIK